VQSWLEITGDREVKAGARRKVSSLAGRQPEASRFNFIEDKLYFIDFNKI
jgi:hypothetical protein